MARKGGKERHKFFAKLVTENRAPCAFCQRDVDEETIYGKLYAIGDIQCHYFCVLLSCCLVQKGKDSDGLFGFMYPDILAEIERSKKHKCSYCSKDGATLGCCISQCRKQFHLPCGREKNAVSLFYGNFKSYCQSHAPKQKIADVIMSSAKVRMQQKRKALRNLKEKDLETSNDIKSETSNDIKSETSESLKSEYVCVICYEEVDAFPSLQTFWPPCCARDAWMHRSCLQRMALSAGMHYLKCPLCNDKENFYQAVIEQGYYVPDRDAAWELEQNAFAEIYERPLSCSIEECKCPLGRNHDSDAGLWDIKLCLLCGSTGAHAHCLNEGEDLRYVCATCLPAAPTDLDKLVADIEAVMVTEQTGVSNTRRGPLMPSRMSLRRTKQRMAYGASGSSSHSNSVIHTKPNTEQITSSREDLNLKTPEKQIRSDKREQIKQLDNNYLSPMKLIEQKLKEKMSDKEMQNGILDESLVEMLRQKIGKPKPLCKKRKIVDGILEDLLNNATNEKRKIKEPLKEWNSPKKNSDIGADYQEQQPYDDITKVEESNIKVSEDSTNSSCQPPPEFAEHNSDESIPLFETPKKTKTVEIRKDSSMEISENNDVINIDVVEIENPETSLPNLNSKSPQRRNEFVLKFSPKDKNLKNNNVDIDFVSFKNQYLNEVGRDFTCKYNHKHDSRSTSPKLRTAIEFAIDSVKENRKRKLKSHKSASKKKRKSNLILKYEYDDNFKGKKRKKKKKTKLSIRNDNMQVKISLKKEKFRLRIMQSRNENTQKTLKQYILKHSPGSSKDVIEKPEKDVVPIKRKHIKLEKSPDNLKQMSIHSFFKPNPSKD